MFAKVILFNYNNIF